RSSDPNRCKCRIKICGEKCASTAKSHGIGLHMAIGERLEIEAVSVASKHECPEIRDRRRQHNATAVTRKAERWGEGGGGLWNAAIQSSPCEKQKVRIEIDCCLSTTARARGRCAALKRRRPANRGKRDGIGAELTG